MCVSCGCGQPNNNHGDSRNITQSDLNNAAQAAGISTQQAAQNIGSSQSQGQGENKTIQQASGSGTIASNHSQGPGFAPGPSDTTGTSPQVAS